MRSDPVDRTLAPRHRRRDTIAMYIGGGIFLLVVGAILAFGVTDQQIGALDVAVVGWVMMGGGILAIVLSLMLQQQRANTTHTEVVERRDLGGPPPRY